MSNDLEPCPFCNGVCIARAGHHMTCVRCGAEGPDADNATDEEAIAQWNRREGCAAIGAGMGERK